jgi:uncharacterized protein
MSRRFATAFTFVAVGLAASLSFDAGFAQQQEQPPQRRGLLEMLFGPRIVQPPPAAPTAVRKARKPRRSSTKRQQPAVPAVEVAKKDPDARRILVVGDFVAGRLAWGLEQTFAEEPKVAVIDEANSASGLVRDDYFDWPGKLPDLLSEEKPDIVVVVIGANDRQQMRIGGKRLARGSESWTSNYVQRVDRMVDTLKVYGRPFFWVTAPPMRSSSASRDMATFNDFYKPRVTAAGGHFVDIWNGFTNEDGHYISSGPDVDGQLRALRDSDGINFTRAGRLKLAFYVERDIRRLTGLGSGGGDLFASTSGASQIEIGPDGKQRLVGPVISLTDPLPATGVELAGAPPVYGDSLIGGADVVKAQPDTESSQYLLVVRGVTLPAAVGRADDYAWPPSQRAAVPFVEPPEPEEATTTMGDITPPIPTIKPQPATN